MNRKSNGINKLVILNIVFVLLLIGASTYLYLENRNLNSELTMSETQRQKVKNDKYIEEIAKTLTLPDESPFFVINVIDPEKAKADNPELGILFGELKADDFILVYKKAKLGIQYRPSEKKIVKTNTVVLPIIVEILGSEQAMADLEKKLANFGNQITVIKTIKDGITQSFVFDVDSDQQAEADSIAKQLGLDTGSTLLSGITPSEQTEIVIAVTSTSTTPVSTEPITQEP